MSENQDCDEDYEIERRTGQGMESRLATDSDGLADESVSSGYGDDADSEESDGNLIEQSDGGNRDSDTLSSEDTDSRSGGVSSGYAEKNDDENKSE
jgi:hypothetical protein